MEPSTVIFICLAICNELIPRGDAYHVYENAYMNNKRHPSGSVAMSGPYAYPSNHASTRFGDFANEEKSGSEFYSRLAGGGEPTKPPINTASFTGGPWGRSWYPRAPEQGKPIESSSSGGMKTDKHGRVQMGVANKDCDDARTNLTRDWDFSPVDYTCFHPESRFPQNPDLLPLLNCVDLPANYTPNHLCMDASITYADKIPTYGDHRPLWPKFGEYLYVPKQRWLHNIEHGAVVMLYHPCAHPEEVKQLKSIVSQCYGKHVITPNTDVDPERPLELVAWGCSLKMAVVDEPLVIKFIHEKGMKGPEGTYTKEGQFDFGLLRIANATKGSRYDRITCASPVM